MIDDRIIRLRKRIVELEEALQFAIEIIGHPDDAGTLFLKGILTRHGEPS